MTSFDDGILKYFNHFTVVNLGVSRVLQGVKLFHDSRTKIYGDKEVNEC